MAVDAQLLERARRNPTGLAFTEAVTLAQQLGWREVRIRGSHHIFTAHWHLTLRINARNRSTSKRGRTAKLKRTRFGKCCKWQPPWESLARLISERKDIRVQNLPPYTYRIFRDEPSGEHVAECQEIPSLSGVGETPAEAMGELQEAVAGWLEMLEEQRLPFPASEAALRKSA